MYPQKLCELDNGVSTHAPARGATNQLCHNVAHIVFQPTHPHGVRPCFTVSCKRLMCFNPRTRTGCDEFLIWSGFEILCFNPRTRTGCDKPQTLPGYTLGSFNPRTRTGCDAFLIQDFTFVLLFQPTHPHGVRLSAHSLASFTVKGFNPRTRTGCDCRGACGACDYQRFNPRTRTGCDGNACIWYGSGYVSTHAPARGATLQLR